jgi:hypothetical protein
LSDISNHASAVHAGPQGTFVLEMVAVSRITAGSVPCLEHENKNADTSRTARIGFFMGWVDLISWYLTQNAVTAILFCFQKKLPEKMTLCLKDEQVRGHLSDNAYTASAILAFKTNLVQNSPTFASLQPEAPERYFFLQFTKSKIDNYG